MLALMADKEYFGPPPAAAVFADTGWEPKTVYENVAWLKSELTYPVFTVKPRQPLIDDVEQGQRMSGRKGISIPVYLRGTADAELWRRTVKLDHDLRQGIAAKAGLKKVPYLHRSGLPLEEAVEQDAENLRKNLTLFDSGWGNECGGHCGV